MISLLSNNTNFTYLAYLTSAFANIICNIIIYLSICACAFFIRVLKHIRFLALIIVRVLYNYFTYIYLHFCNRSSFIYCSKFKFVISFHDYFLSFIKCYLVILLIQLLYNIKIFI
jgi:hypothetical protein